MFLTATIAIATGTACGACWCWVYATINTKGRYGWARPVNWTKAAWRRCAPQLASNESYCHSPTLPSSLLPLLSYNLPILRIQSYPTPKVLRQFFTIPKSNPFCCLSTKAIASVAGRDTHTHTNTNSATGPAHEILWSIEVARQNATPHNKPVKLDVLKIYCPPSLHSVTPLDPRIPQAPIQDKHRSPFSGIKLCHVTTPTDRQISSRQRWWNSHSERWNSTHNNRIYHKLQETKEPLLAKNRKCANPNHCDPNSIYYLHRNDRLALQWRKFAENRFRVRREVQMRPLPIVTTSK